MAKYIEAPERKHKVITNHSIFLAGGITGCGNWQAQTTDELMSIENLTILNPRRKNWDMNAGPEVSVLQIKWEYDFLRKATEVLFWFTPDTLQPIALYELGATLQRNAKVWNTKDKVIPTYGQTIFIGCDPNYQRKFDVQVQAKLIGYPYKVYESLESLLACIKDYYDKLNRRYAERN